MRVKRVLASAVLGCLAGLLAACAAGSSLAPEKVRAAQAQEQQALETFFLQWRQAIQRRDWPEVLKGLSQPSRRWLDDVARSARMDDVAALRDKTFEEVLFILALRVDRRLDPALDDRPLALVARLFAEGSPLRRAFLHAELGAYRVSGDRAELGLREAPRVPVFEFVREPQGWALHWQRTLPLILRGAESQSRPHGRDKVEQAIWLLRTWAGKEVYAEDLRPR